MPEKFREQSENEDVIDTTKDGKWMENEEGVFELEKDAEVITESLEVKEDKEHLIENIKKLILEEKVAEHGMFGVFSTLIERYRDKHLEIFKDEYTQEKKEKAKKILESLFREGIWSSRKINRSIAEGKGKIETKGGYGPESQEFTAERGAMYLESMLDYLKNKRASGAKVENIDYEEMIHDTIFLENIKHKMGWEKINPPESDRYLSSPRTYFAFRRLKQDSFAERWHVKDGSGYARDFAERKKDYSKENRAIANMADVLYGTNLVSSTPPWKLKKVFEETGEVDPGCYDSMQILFLLPPKAHTFEISDADLGITNRVAPQNFIAAVINKELIDENIQVPESVLDIIPKELPVITSDFKILRMPQGK